MQLNSTNGSSAHDMVSLARQTERFPNPAGFISGAHLVKGQQKESTQKTKQEKPQWEHDFLSGAGVFSLQLNALPLTKVVSVGQTSAALQR